jgi:ABC-type sugar transport system ATPase subunit
MASIELEGVSKLYGEVVAVSGLDLNCPDGEMLALLGPSGCGKSSTLKMIAGIEAVTRGEIRFGGRTVNGLSPSERNLAMVFEDYALYPHLTAFENIAFPLKLKKFERREIAKRVDNALHLLGLEQWRDRDVRTLSGGAQQRISIGRALVRDPELILFDEPLSHLDADQKIFLRTEIKRLQQETGLTSILVTHDQTEATALADRIAIMDHGVLQQVGPPQELYDAPHNLFVANFIGEPPMNFLTLSVEPTSTGLRLTGSGLNLALEGTLAARLDRARSSGDIVIGIRPEHAGLGSGGPDTLSVEGAVFYREPRGDADVLLIDLDGRASNEPARLAVELAGPTSLPIGGSVALNFPIERLLFFAAATGRNLLAAAAE